MASALKNFKGQGEAETMPRFGEQDGFQTVAYITGPSHVTLGLRFGTSASERLSLHKRPALGTCTHGLIDEEQVDRAIHAGVARANAESGATVAVSEAFYVENDSPRYALYQHCAYLLALRAGG